MDKKNKNSKPATNASMSEYGTLTAKQDANNDYSSKSGSKSNSSGTQASTKKTQTSDKNIGR